MRAPADNSSPPVLELCGVAAGAMRDPSHLVVEGVDWTVRSGEYWALAGLQGTGKSDFLMMTAGLLPPARGEYRMFGEAMPIFREAGLATRLRLGLVFDGGRLFSHLTLAENVALPLRYHQNLTAADAAERTQAFLEAMELCPFAQRLPGVLARNWQQRAALARALMLRPEVLLLDAPLTRLDLREAHWWLEFLDQLSAGHALLEGRPLTLVATTGNLRAWQGHAGQFALMKDRQFAVLGDWAAVERSREPVVCEMLAADLPAALGPGMEARPATA